MYVADEMGQIMRVRTEAVRGKFNGLELFYDGYEVRRLIGEGELSSIQIVARQDVLHDVAVENEGDVVYFDHRIASILASFAMQDIDAVR